MERECLIINGIKMPGAWHGAGAGTGTSRSGGDAAAPDLRCCSGLSLCQSAAVGTPLDLRDEGEAGPTPAPLVPRCRGPLHKGPRGWRVLSSTQRSLVFHDDPCGCVRSLTFLTASCAPVARPFCLQTLSPDCPALPPCVLFCFSFRSHSLCG